MSATSMPARRFYKQASAITVDGGYGVRLDERNLRTPGGAVFLAPTHALADACASEWAAQGELIAPALMPLSQFAFATLDATARRREEICTYVASFGETDLCCHRAAAPPDLVKRQALVWDPLVAWGADALGVSLPVVTGVIAADVEAEILTELRSRAERLDDFRLTALGHAAGLAGSALIAFALVHGLLPAVQAFEAAALDNLWSQERWGRDEEAQARLDRQRAEFVALARFIETLGA